MESGRSRKLNPGSLTVGPQCLPSVSQGRGSGCHSFKERSKIMPSFVEHLLPSTNFKIHILIFNPPTDLSGTIITNCPAQKSSGQGGMEPNNWACQDTRSAGLCAQAVFFPSMHTPPSLQPHPLPNPRLHTSARKVQTRWTEATGGQELGGETAQRACPGKPAIQHLVSKSKKPGHVRKWPEAQPQFHGSY